MNNPTPADPASAASVNPTESAPAGPKAAGPKMAAQIPSKMASPKADFPEVASTAASESVTKDQPAVLASAAQPLGDSAPVGPESTPQQLVAWGLQQFADRSIVLTSSFGMEGCALIDMCSKALTTLSTVANITPPKITVACIDTGFFFPETKKLRQQLIDRYSNLEFVNWETPVSVEQQRELYGDLLWKNNPNMCCNIRKVQPMRENVVKYQVWMTALRRSQTQQRADTPVLAWDWMYQLLKFCPLASWARADVWAYVQQHDVPFNQLHLQNYPSVSCFHCTKPVPGSSPDSDARSGRWEGTEKSECGLHFSI